VSACHLCRQPLDGPPARHGAERVRWDKPALWAVRALCSDRCFRVWRALAEFERLHRVYGSRVPGGPRRVYDDPG